VGIFAEHQAEYARHNIRTFPMRGKRPAVTGYQKADFDRCEQWKLKFPDVEAFAFMAGPRNRIMVIDIDSSDNSLLNETMKRYGEPPIVVQTPSGGFHLWYQHAGEARQIRPDATVPVDILGGGVVVAPPSLGSKGKYRFVRGGLNALPELMPASNVSLPPRACLAGRVLDIGETKHIDSVGGVVGGRNSALFRHLMKQAQHLDNLADLEALGFDFANNHFDRALDHPFTDAEIRATARSVREITERGENRFGGKPHSHLNHETRDILHKLGPDALYLHSVLKGWNSGVGTFIAANGMAESLPSGLWARKRFVAARTALVAAGLLVEVRPASTGMGPALYRWP